MVLTLWPELTTYTPCSQVKLVGNGEEFLDCLIDMIEQAQTTIHFHMYIFYDDRCGLRVLQALQKAVGRNVQVYMLLDALGSYSLSQSFIDRVREAGIHFKWFGKLWALKSLKGLSFRRRLHQKVVVVDHHQALIGGMNIGERYICPDNLVPWLDFAVLVSGGELIANIMKSCISLWNSCPGHKIPLAREQRPSLPYSEGVLDAPASPLKAPPPSCGSMLVRLRENDWSKRKVGIYRSYLQAIKEAQSRISIVGSYFLPDRKVRRALRKAARRGVSIRLILTHTSDVPIVTRAAQHIYRLFLHEGIQIFEWLPSVVHGKLAVVDGRWVTIGSYNLNDLLGYSTVEMNLDIYDPAFAQLVENRLDHFLQAGCRKVTMENWQKTETPWQKLLAFLSYYTLKALLKLSLLFSGETRMPTLKKSGKGKAVKSGQEDLMA